MHIKQKPNKIINIFPRIWVRNFAHRKSQRGTRKERRNRKLYGCMHARPTDSRHSDWFSSFSFGSLFCFSHARTRPRNNFNRYACRRSQCRKQPLAKPDQAVLMRIFAYQMHINLLKLTISAFQHYFTSYLHPHIIFVVGTRRRVSRRRTNVSRSLRIDAFGVCAPASARVPIYKSS